MAELLARGLYSFSYMSRSSQHGLLVLTPSALTARHSDLAYMRGALVSPVCLSVAVFAACFGLGLAGIPGVIAAVVAVVSLGAIATRYRFVRRHLDNHAEVVKRCEREAGRLRQLRTAGPVVRAQYLELRGLVEQIEETDRSEAERFELQDLLEHYVRLAGTRQRCMDALEIAGANELPQTIPFEDVKRSKRRREILARRLRHREQCQQRIDRVVDELGAVDELVRLVAQRVACPPADLELDREVDRRLWELDEVDAALRQLSA
jgi:tRNA threonylcarbamoyladenosine modification (KEOPS) complex Cgi121 subunit